MALAEWLRRDRARLGDTPRESRETRPVSALEALAAHRELTLLGKPGGGKSTFGAHVLLALAQAWQGHSAELEHLGETWTHGPLLPIRVVLRRFAEQLPSGDQPARAGDLWDFIGRDLKASGYGLSDRTMEYVQRIARNTGALLLLDGLDECGSSAARERVLSAVSELMRTAGPRCRFLLTARPYAWPGGPRPRAGRLRTRRPERRPDRAVHPRLVPGPGHPPLDLARRWRAQDGRPARRPPAPGSGAPGPKSSAAHPDGDPARQPRPAAGRPGGPLQRVRRSAHAALEPPDRRRQGAAR